MDFLGSFLFITFLVVLTALGSVVYLSTLIFRKVFSGIKARKNEEKILNIADAVTFYQENKKVENIEDIIKNIKIPKKMQLLEEDSDVIIKYEKLTYSLNKGRFLGINV